MFLFSISSVCAQDWPQWRGPDRDGKVSGFTTPQEWPKELKQVWQTKVGLGDASIALVGEKLYVFTRQGDEEAILCLNAGSGDELWRNAYTTPAVTGPPGSHPGPRSTPTVADGKVVTLGVNGVLSCLNAADGNVVWRKDEYTKTVPEFFTAMSPIVVDGMCIAHLGGKDNGVLLAFDLASGAQKWKWEGDGPTYSSPVLMTVEGMKQLVVQTEKNLIGFDPVDGKLLWQIATPNQRRFYSSSTPIVDGQTLIVTGQGGGTKAYKIAKQDDKFVTEELWINEEPGVAFNTPVLKNGLLYGLNVAGNIFCLNAKTGKSAWTDSNRIDRFGSILDAGSVLVALSPKSEFIVFKPSDTYYEEVARIKVSETPIYAHPLLAGNHVFIKDQESVTKFSIE
jgi:outer membrane protein assembly factor BamB